MIPNPTQPGGAGDGATKVVNEGASAQPPMTQGNCKKRRVVAKGKWTRKVNQFNKAVTDNLAVTVLGDPHQQAKDAFENLESVCNELVWLTFDERQFNELQEENTLYMEEAENDLTNMLVKLTVNSSESGNQANAVVDGCEVKVRKLDPPSFDGSNIDEYLTFKADYKRIVERQYKRDPFALKQTLSGEA